MTAEDQKRAAGEAAALLVEDRMVVGLGTGSTAAFFVRALALRAAREGLAIRGVPTSQATAELAHAGAIPLVELDQVGELDLVVDGADEIGPGLDLVKGGGGALLREKLVWEAARRRVVIADAAKRVAQLGAFPLPVEVVGFGHGVTARRIAHAAMALGCEAAPRLRQRNGRAVQSDNGNPIYDLPCGAIVEPQALARTLKGLTGVVEHGLFLGLADEALIGTDEGVVRATS
ncbi:MAG: ribose-5-phosphate isomerase RpiA [Pseudomonadota bacterium]|nr:ribose-5-phosphate isomerase RpiA [Pseudomonadota bacterium]